MMKANNYITKKADVPQRKPMYHEESRCTTKKADVPQRKPMYHEESRCTIMETDELCGNSGAGSMMWYWFCTMGYL